MRYFSHLISSQVTSEMPKAASSILMHFRALATVVRCVYKSKLLAGLQESGGRTRARFDLQHTIKLVPYSNKSNVP